MHISVLEAVKMGLWDYEPPKVEDAKYSSTRASWFKREVGDIGRTFASRFTIVASAHLRNYSDLNGDHDD